MIDAAGLIATAAARGVSPAVIAYEMVTANPWRLGRCSYIGQRWRDVSEAMGVDEETFRPMRSMFEPQFIEACAAHVRKHFGMG